MSNKPLHIGEEAAVQMPMKTVVSLIIIVALGTMGYFQIVERLNIAENIEMNMSNKLKIEFMEGQINKLLVDVEELKDANREIVYKNGTSN